MKVCPNCQMANDDLAFSCAVCGSMLPENKKKKSGIFSGKIWPMAIAALLAIALVIGSATGVKALMGSGLSGAYETAVEDLVDHFTKQTNAQINAEKMSDLWGKGKYALRLAVSGSKGELDLTLDYQKSSSAMTGQILYAGADGLNLDMAYFANKKVVQMIPSGDSLNVYGFSVKDFEKKFQNSLLTKILPVSLPESNLLDLLKARDLEDFLNKASNGAYKDLKKTIKVENQGKRTLTLMGSPEKYKVYQVRWDAKSLTNTLKAMDGAQAFSGVVNYLESVLVKVEPDCYLYLDKKGDLRAADFVAVGNQYMLALNGVEDPWEDLTLTCKSIDGTSHVYTGGVKTDGTEVKLELASAGVPFFAVTYDDQTGAFSLETQSMGTLLSGSFQGTENGVTLTLNLLPSGVAQQLIVEIGPLKQTPEKFTDSYIDLFSLDLNNIQRILSDLGIY